MSLLPRKEYYKKILELALPVIAGLSTQMILSLVDTAMVGRLDNAKYALAAMGLGLMATWALISVSSSLSTGTHIMVARRYGENNYDACKDVLMNSLFIGVLFGAAVAFLGMYYAFEIGDLFAEDPIVGQLSGEYLYYRILGLPFFLITVSYRGFFFGIGNTKVFMVSAMTINMLNILFNYMFIYGEFGAPEMGLAGAAFGSSVATVCDAVYHSFVALFVSNFRKKFNLFRHIRVLPQIIKSIFSLSLPVSFQNVFILVGFLSFMAITGLIGTLEQAASQTIVSTLFISFLPCNGFGIAIQTMVGNNVGQGKKMVAKIFGFEAAKLATYYTVALGLVFILIPDALLIITTNDYEIIEAADPAIRIAGFAQIFFATGIVMANGLQAVGKTVFVMITEIVTNLMIFVPLSYIFGVVLGWGLEGAWFAICFYTIPYAATTWAKFRYGKWDRLREF